MCCDKSLKEKSFECQTQTITNQITYTSLVMIEDMKEIGINMVDVFI
jgi:hypothetical protein